MRNGRRSAGRWLAIAVLMGGWAGATDAAGPRVGERLERGGDEISACGVLFHTTAPVVLWNDPGGYDAYRVERRFVPPDRATWAEAQAAGITSPNRYGNRDRALTPAQVAKVHAEGWDLADLRGVVDQFVIHFDARGTSNQCFQVLHDARTLSVHFMLDVDGTIYQTLDLKEKAFHATIANTRSIGIEVANIGAYAIGKPSPALEQWYASDVDGRTRMTIPETARPASIRRREAPFRPIRDDLVVGTVQGQELRQYDFTPQQYDSLIKLTATLCTVFPRIRCDYPRDPSGALVAKKLDEGAYEAFQGILGHFHVQANKVDPGPAFQWDRVLGGAKGLMGR